MALETTTDVESISSVLGPDNSTQSPANAQKQEELLGLLANEDSVTAGDYTTDSTNTETLPAEAIPHGVDVVIQAQEPNAGAVYVGDDASQPIRLAPTEGIELGVTDLAAVYVQAVNSGDGVNYIYEG